MTKYEYYKEQYKRSSYPLIDEHQFDALSAEIRAESTERIKELEETIKGLEESLAKTQSLVISYGEKITEQKDSLLNMCAMLGKMGYLAYHNIQVKLTEVFGDEEGARRAAIKKEQWKNVERKCKELVERNNRPIELTVGDKHVSPQDLGWH